MDIIIENLKAQRPYSELKKLLETWDHPSREHLFLDLAILHKSFDGVRLVGDLLGPEIYLTTYDDFDKVTPIYVSQLLNRLHPDYQELTDYMLQRVEDEKPWNRRKLFLWALKFCDQEKMHLPQSLVREMVFEYL